MTTGYLQLQIFVNGGYFRPMQRKLPIVEHICNQPNMGCELDELNYMYVSIVLARAIYPLVTSIL